MRRIGCLLLGGAGIILAAAPDYDTDIQPLLAKRCGGCHSGEAKMGEFSISTYALLVRGGNHGKGVLPGNPDESPLYNFITGKLYPKMPMDGTTLADAEIALIKAWIQSGAQGPAVPAKASREASKVEAAPVGKPKGPAKPRIFALAWQPGAKVVALARHLDVTLADSASGNTLATLGGHADAVRNVVFSRDGKWLAAAGGICGKQGEVKIWNVADRSLAATIKGHDDCIYGLAFSPDGKLVATSSYDKLVKLWNPGTGELVKTLKDHIDAVYALAFTPDGKRIISASADRGVKIWDVASGTRLYTFSEALDALNTVTIDPAGKLVAAAGVDKTIRIWRMDERGGELTQSLMAHEDAILKLAWSPDGATLASSSADKSIRLFRASDLTELKRMAGQPDWTFGLEFSADGKQLAVARMDGSYALLEVTK